MADNDLPKKSEVDKHLPEGHVASRDQTGKPQPLQGMTDVLGHNFPVVVSTGHTTGDEIERELLLAQNPPQPWIPAQDPTPLEEGDPVPVNPVTGELSFQGGPSKILSPVLPVAATEGGTTTQTVGTPDLGEVHKADETPATSTLSSEEAGKRAGTGLGSAGPSSKTSNKPGGKSGR